MKHPPVDLTAPRKKKALVTKAHDLDVPIPHGFGVHAPWVGKACRQLLRDVAKAAHLTITGTFDQAMMRLLFPPPTQAELREEIVAVGRWGTEHSDDIHYTQDGRRSHGLGEPKFTLPLYLDCSMWVDLSCKWAGVPAKHCPMGNQYRPWGNTETLIETLRGLNSIKDLKLGDPIVWGVRGSTHHTAYVIAAAGTDNPLLSSHGQEKGPLSITFADENEAQAGRHATPLSLF